MQTKREQPSVNHIDVTGIGRKDVRDRMLGLLRELEIQFTEETAFWPSFLGMDHTRLSQGTLVLCDLSSAVRRFREHERLRWITSVRQTRPFFVAFVRNERDRSVAEYVDDLLRASDLRLDVCNDSADRSAVSRCLLSAIAKLQPDTLAEVRYLATGDNLWVQFGDGLTGILEWSDLGIEAMRPNLIAASATVSSMGSSIELLESTGEIFDIDAGVARAVLDERHRRYLEGEAETHAVSLGARIKARRERAMLTQQALAQRTGLDQAVISRMEGGRVRPRIDTLRKFADALGLSVSDLLSHVDV